MNSYFTKICKKTTKTVKKYNLIEEGDRILVGISGGKDSLILMHILENLRRRAPFKFEIIAGTFSPGFDSFNVKKVEEYIRAFDWEFHIAEVDIQPILDEVNTAKNPCALCSRIRRGNLYKLMDELGCNKLALGHHLDDLCISLLISLFRGHGLKTMGPNVKADAGRKRVIRPLACINQDWIIEAVKSFDFPTGIDCDYKEQLKNNGDRAFFVDLLRNLESKFPNIKENMLASMSNVESEHLLDLKFLVDI